MNPDAPTPAPSPSSQPPAPANGSDPRGSLALGIGLFFLCLIGGSLVVWLLGWAMSLLLPHGSYIGLAFSMVSFLPWLAALSVGIMQALKGRTRTALGVLVGFGLLLALALLFVAACFGMFAFSL